MSRDNMVICYEGVQRIYRNAVVRFLRTALHEAFPIDSAQKLRAPFKTEEWERITSDAASSRESGELETHPIDDFDLLSVNHFYNVFEKYYEVLLKHEVVADARQKSRQKQTLLSWLRDIKNLRDPLSHPAEVDFSFPDTFRVLDGSRRVLLRLGLEKEARGIEGLMDQLLGAPLSISSDTTPLEGWLPSREAIVIDFVGREPELKGLWEWLLDPMTRRRLLAGDGGKGKSAIAYSFALDVRNKAPRPLEFVFWLSAKKRRFLEGKVVSIDEPDFYNLDSALEWLLIHYGWVREAESATDSKRRQVLELLNELPALVVVDDIDSLESEHENVIEFFSVDVPATKSKVLFTSRRIPYGMGASTTRVRGFNEEDGERFIYSRCDLMDVDKQLFSKSMIKRAVSATEGSPLYIEDLMRLTATASSAEAAIQLWADREGNDARRYALQRECELLNSNARRVLLAASIVQGPVSFAEIEAITGISTTAMNSALQDLQGVFLIPKPRVIEGEQRFEINLNTRSLVRETYENDDLYRRTETAYRAFSGEIPRARSGDVAAVIRQAHFLVKTLKHHEAERLLLTALEKYQSNPDLTGFLGWVYKAWPKPRITDARAQFARAYQLRCKKHDMYVHWCRMELDAGEWTKAAEAAEKASRVLPDNRTLFFFAGYARTRLGRELLSGLHFEKARREFSEARALLEKSLKGTVNADTQEPTSTSRIYRTLVLVCEHSEDLDGLRHYFKLWWGEHPDDPICKSEWERVSRRYSLPMLDKSQVVEPPEKPQTREIRVYDVAKELRLDDQRVMADVRAEGVEVRLPMRDKSPVAGPPEKPRPRKIRVYDLAQELKLKNKKVMDDARAEGVEVSMPSSTMPIEVAERIREKHRPPKKPDSSTAQVRSGNKMRIYELAKELKLDFKNVMADARKEGIDVSVPSNTVPIDVADRIRAKYKPPPQRLTGVRLLKR